MDPYEKLRLNHGSLQQYLWLSMKLGFNSIFENLGKAIAFALYCLALYCAWTFRKELIAFDSENFLSIFHLLLWETTFPLYVVIGTGFFLAVLGFVPSAKKKRDNLARSGVTNYAGDAPRLVAERPDPKNNRVKIMEFLSNGIPVNEWEDKRMNVETGLNANIVKIEEGEDKSRILVYAVPSHGALPKFLDWHDDFLHRGNGFVLTLGESAAGPVAVDLARIPHILLGGSTGSGKSILLKLLILQSLQKGASVMIADFKGGVDFPSVWHKKCRIITEKEGLHEMLKSMVSLLERRKDDLRMNGCSSMEEYNKIAPLPMLRVVIAFDEVAEALDKLGLAKHEKDLTLAIESKLSIIARQGRAFGIHLILSTQRPDANILSGQIKNNIDFRVCGRADSVLSQIVLDNTDADDRIPKDAQGRFLLKDGTLLQSYWFTEEDVERAANEVRHGA